MRKEEAKWQKVLWIVFMLLFSITATAVAAYISGNSLRDICLLLIVVTAGCAGVVFALKAGLGIGGAILGFLLSGFGYVSGAGIAQSESAIHGIVLSSSIIPAVTFFIGVIALYFYPITKKYNEEMQAELTERRSKEDY